MAEIKNQAILTFKYTGVNDATVKSNIATVEFQGPITATLKTVKTTYQLNKPINFVSEVTNTSANDLTNVTVKNNLGAYVFPAGSATKVTPLTYVDGSAVYFIGGVYKGTITPTTGSIVFTIPTLKKGEILTILYQAVTNEFATWAPIKVTTEIDADEISVPFETTDTLTVGKYADVSIIKSMVPNPVSGNGPITYTFTLTNSGNDAATSIALSDTFELSPDITKVMVGVKEAFKGADYKYQNDVFELTSYNHNEGTLELPAATFTQNPVTGAVTIAPSTLEITVTATI